jgi:hypothetical protein
MNVKPIPLLVPSSSHKNIYLESIAHGVLFTLRRIHFEMMDGRTVIYRESKYNFCTSNGKQKLLT